MPLGVSVRTFLERFNRERKTNPEWSCNTPLGLRTLTKYKGETELSTSLAPFWWQTCCEQTPAQRSLQWWTLPPSFQQKQLWCFNCLFCHRHEKNNKAEFIHVQTVHSLYLTHSLPLLPSSSYVFPSLSLILDNTEFVGLTTKQDWI